MKQPAQHLSDRARIQLRACAISKAWPALGTACGSPRADMAMRTWSEWWQSQGGSVGSRGEVCGKVLFCLCQEDLFVSISLSVTPMKRQLGVEPSGSELGSEPGFSSKLCPDRSSLFTGLGRWQALLTLLAPVLCDAGAESRADSINLYPEWPFKLCLRSSSLSRGSTWPPLPQASHPPAKDADSSTAD